MRIFLSCFFLVFLVAATAYADCGLVPNGTTILVPETRPPGAILYNSDHQVFQGCVEDHWVSLSMSAAGIGQSLIGPADCPDPGDLCADGTVFVGWDPLRHEPLYIPPNDQGTTSQWKTSAGIEDILADSIGDGRANSDQVPNSTTFPAFKLCKDLTAGGHNDWYLPSQVELYYLWTMQSAIEAAGNITNFQSAAYWSSTEYNDGYGWYQGFVPGGQGSYWKTESYRIRCIRRQ